MIHINTTLKTFFKIVIMLLLLSVLGLLICTALIFQDDNTDKYNSAPSPQVLETIAKNAIIENETQFTESELNGLFAFLIQQVNEKNIFPEDYRIKAVYLEINDTSPCRLYIQTCLNGRDIGLSADVELRLTDNSELIFTLSNTKAGKLSIPRSILISILKKTDLQKSEYVSINDLSVTLPAHYEYEIENLGTLINIEISGLYINDGVVHITTNPIVSDLIDNIKGFFMDGLSGGIDYFKDKIPGDFFER